LGIVAIDLIGVAMARKNVDSELRSKMLSTKGKKDIIAQGLV
jgi:hypothetical protein